MKSLCFSFAILVFFAALFSAADAWRFNVGGNGVWAMNPQENYKTWASRNRFQVNDTLYFKYVKGLDSVQQVMKSDFDGCNVENPLKKFDNGESEVTLDRSGPFYFISGNKDHCKKGQKLIVVVLAVRNHTTVPISPAKSPSPAQSPSPASSISPAKSPAPARSPKSPSPASPVSPAKSPSPAQSPKSPSPVPTISPAKSPSPALSPKSPISPAKSPSHSPVSPSHAPAKSPTIPSPSPKSPSPASALSPSSPPKSLPSPDQAPIAPAPEQTQPTSSPSPTDNITAPAPSPRRNGASDVAVNSVMTSVVSVALTVMLFA